MCHGNYEKENLADVHRRVGIRCAKCHGESEKHSGDENNITPPDIVYAAGKIDLGCRKCHAEHDVPARKVVARWLERCPAKINVQTIVCTDCHGDHCLTVRTRRWDKDTGKLIADDGVRMMDGMRRRDK